MFKVIADYDDPTQVKSFANYVDIFNPVLNPIPPGLTVQQYINALKVFWSRENILANPGMYFTFSHDSHLLGDDDRLEIVKKLIKPIDDDRLFAFNWLTINRITEGNQIQFYFHRFSDVRESRRVKLFWYCNPSYRTSGQYSYRGDNYPDEIRSYVDNQLDQVALLTQHASYKVESDVGTPSYCNSTFGHRYNSYLLNQLVFQNSDGNHLRPSQAADILRADPNAQLIDPAHLSFNFTIRSPITKDNKTPLYRMMSYSASPTAVLPWPLTEKGEHKPTLYGVELELATDYNVQNLIDATDEPFFIVKQDSSVSGSKRNRFELATVPMSYKTHKKQWAHWFSNLDYDKFDCSTDTNNGMHVHIGKESFIDPGHVKNFVWFFTQPAHIEFMRLFSQRSTYQFNEYAGIPSPASSRSRVQAFQRQEARVRDMRGCVHFSHKGTIEVRLFKGVVSLAEIIKNMEFVDSIFHYTMGGQNFLKMSLKEYITWLHTQPKNKYAIIKKYLERTPKLKDLIEASALLSLIFNEKNPDKIIEIVEKHKFPITNVHVSILNARWKKRILILKDGKLIPNPANLAALSTLDRLLEQRILGKVKKAA